MIKEKSGIVFEVDYCVISVMVIASLNDTLADHLFNFGISWEDIIFHFIILIITTNY